MVASILRISIVARLARVRNPHPCTRRIACPVCGEALADQGASARCAAGHSFDFARSGYLNLTIGGDGPGRVGDDAAMVAARAEFLAAGHYEPLAAAVAEAAAAAAPEGDGAVAEVGSGTGHYLAAVVAALAERGRHPACAFGVDLSKAAAERAAKLHPELRFLVADAEAAIPLCDASAGLCLSVFAPRPAAELGRIARPGGALVAALAGPRHLERLRARLELIEVGADKLARLTERLDPWFEPAEVEAVEFELRLGPEDARRLVLMGPNARHQPDLAPLASGHEDRASVTVASFRRR